MNKLKVIAKTEIGEKAIKQHIEESLKQKWVVRVMLQKTGFHQEISCKKPYTLLIWATKNSMFSMTKIPHLQGEIDLAMEANGAKKDIDYYYEDEK